MGIHGLPSNMPVKASRQNGTDMDLKHFLLAYFSSEGYEPLRMKELADRFGLIGDDRNALYELLDELLVAGEIRMTKKGRMKSAAAESEETASRSEQAQAPKAIESETEVGSSADKLDESKRPQHDEPKMVSAVAAKADRQVEAAETSTEERADEGVLRGNAKGFAFFISDREGEPDTFIGPDDLKGALHGDRVRIRVVRKADPMGKFKQEGKVVKILARSKEKIIGTYRSDRGDGLVIPDSKFYSKAIRIDKSDRLGAKSDDKVVVERLETQQAGEPVGRVIEVLGHKDRSGVDITSVARKFELPYQFSPETLEEIKAFGEAIDPLEIRGRHDLRKKFTVTIDGADAKDFDDAISVEKRGKFYNLYVHIADVSHYVRPGSAIDRDAYERGNSVYLLDRVIPMLPEALSNGLCSLNPHEDRLSITTQMTLNESGDVVDYQFYESVIRSDYRLVYDDVSAYMEFGTRFNDDDELYAQLALMKQIYELLEAKRIKRGTINFDFPETTIKLDEKGVPMVVCLAERRTANRVIEAFMILNNETVGRHFYARKVPFIYRIHEEPSEDKIERLNKALYAFGYAPVPADPTPSALSEILEHADGEKEEGVLNMLVLQSMAKARYSAVPEGHFGLAADHYTHFTSPIRRYADLIAHRLMKSYVASGKRRHDDRLRKTLEEQCLHISATEVKAQDAERDVIDMKCAEYMQPYVGGIFKGVVSSLTNFGVFVMLDNTVEGLAHFREMNDDYYTYDEARFVVRGERKKREIHYGDQVDVLLLRSDPEMREIDFKLIWDDEVSTGEPNADGEARRRQPRYGRGAKLTKAFADRGEQHPKNWNGAKPTESHKPRHHSGSRNNRLAGRRIRTESRYK